MPKTCRSCGLEKPLDEFHRHRCYSDGHRSQCKACLNPKARQQMSAKYDYTKHRESLLRRKYGITQGDFEAMVAAQMGTCPICLKFCGQALVVDHDHDTGRLRGLLCSTCNGGMGFLKDDPELLIRAAIYLVGGDRLRSLLDELLFVKEAS